MQADIKSHIQHLKTNYFFRYNEKATKHLTELVNFSAARMFRFGESLFFLEAYSTKTILETDLRYVPKNRFDISGQLAGFFTLLVPYKDMFIIGDYSGKQQIAVSQKFNRIDTLGAIVPELSGKSIVYAVPDNKGGIYFAERATGMLYYLDSGGCVTAYQGSFRMPHAMAYMNDTLFICDIVQTTTFRRGNNIIAFKDGVFSPTGLTGESIVPCPALNAYFVSNMILSYSLAKYDAGLNLIFQRHFTCHDADSLKNFAPTCLCLNSPHLLALDGTTLYIKAFDIIAQ
ncbi:hypothetical protein KDK77_00525 [bacterium]|nr:hypothetical protein [bacterium]MCP5462285.1 hypothetical protein [bacterium]